jgi:hypothetical protein
VGVAGEGRSAALWVAREEIGLWLRKRERGGRETDALCSHQYGSRIVRIGWRWIVDEPCWDLEKALIFDIGLCIE